MDHYQTTDYAMVSQVPTRGVRTTYSRLGDWFAWVCLVGLVLLTVRSLRQRRGWPETPMSKARWTVQVPYSASTPRAGDRHKVSGPP